MLPLPRADRRGPDFRGHPFPGLAEARLRDPEAGIRRRHLPL